MHGGHVIEHADLTVEHRDIDVLATPSGIACIDGGENTHHRKHTTAEIAYGYSGAHSLFWAIAGNRHAAPERLRYLIERRALVCRAIFTEPCHRAGDNFRVDVAQRGIVYAQLFGYARGEITDHDICDADQTIEPV